MSKNFPCPGEMWKTSTVDLVVEIVCLDISRDATLNQNQFVMYFRPDDGKKYKGGLVVADAHDIECDRQCVIYKAGNGYYRRTVANFLKRFERIG